MMSSFIWAQLRHRRARVGALGSAIVLAAVSFVLLASTAKTSDLRVRGSVQSNFRNAYDILIRPRGSFTQLEQNEQLVRNNYLSGIYGGITLAQYKAIQRIRGVDVAAPIANVGYVLPRGRIFVSVRPWLSRDPVQLFRIRLASRAQAGTSAYPGDRGYAYYTRRSRFGEGREITASGVSLDVCAFFGASAPARVGPFARSEYLRCFSSRSPGEGSDVVPEVAPRGGVGVGAAISFPILIAAIDPVQEARLLQLDRAVVTGRYLRPSDRPFVKGVRYVPVIASARTFVDEQLVADVDRLKAANPTRIPFALASPQAYRFVTGLPVSFVGRQAVPASRIYERMLGVQFGSNAYWRPSETRYRSLKRGGDVELIPLPTANPPSIWKNTFNPTGFERAPAANQDLQFRKLRQYIGSNLLRDGVVGTPSFEVVGRYDPSKLPGFSPLSRVPLETYYPPELDPADTASTKVLKGRPLRPTQNLGDYIQQPPLFLTTLDGMKPFLDPRNFSGASAKAPVSVIRVRVKGVKGADELSMERIRAVALEIHDKTGLDVDITAGSSPRELKIRLPPGKFGRPGLLLREGWAKKGVSVAFLKAIDRKSLGLFALIPLICCFYVANGALAVVRARRTEIGTLLSLGWPQAAIFRVLLGEVALIGVIAGLFGTVIAAALAAALSLQTSLLTTLLVLPVSVGLALLAGFIPAWVAARHVPLDAVRPAIAKGPRRSRRVRGLGGMAFLNLRRLPVRTFLGAGGLVVGVAALGLLLGIQRAFEGTLVGTLLGNAILVRVSGLDFLAIGLTIALAAFAAGDVLFLNLRERAPELVTLRTVGWGEPDLRRLVGLEALALGVLGAGTGTLLALLVGIALGVPAVPLVVAAIAAGAGGVLVSLVAAMLPLSQINRLTPPAVLAEE